MYHLHHETREDGAEPMAFQFQDIASVDTVVLELIYIFKRLFFLIVIHTLRNLSMFLFKIILLLLSLHESIFV